MDRDKIKAAAEKATKGPWGQMGGSCSIYKHQGGGAYEIASTRSSELPEQTANADFIALTDPDTVIALLDALDEAEKDVERWITNHRIKHVKHVKYVKSEAENKRLKQGIIDGKTEGVSLVPNDIWDNLQAENTLLRGLVQYQVDLPMNDAGDYDENAKWLRNATIALTQKGGKTDGQT